MATKEQRESESLARLRKELKQFPCILRTIEKYARKDCDEALFVYALDKYINLLFVHETKAFYHTEHYHLTKTEVNDKLIKHSRKAHADPIVGRYYEQLRDTMDAHPEYFVVPRQER